MFKKITKIFKLRMRSNTFPCLCISDLTRVMRDLGLIENIKGGMKQVKEIWFRVLEECTEGGQEAITADVDPTRPSLSPKRDHISMLLGCL